MVVSLPDKLLEPANVAAALAARRQRPLDSRSVARRTLRSAWLSLSLSLLAASCGDAPSAAAVDTKTMVAMNDSEFWDLIGKLDWKRTGDDEAVCRPVVEALAAKPVSAIEAFEEALAQKLHALDTEAHAREIGEEAYTGSDEDFSVDWFLYVRCCVVANGKSLFETVLKNPRRMPKDVEFEALLRIAAEAYQSKTGDEFEFTPSVSYETFSNKAGWQR